MFHDHMKQLRVKQTFSLIVFYRYSLSTAWQTKSTNTYLPGLEQFKLLSNSVISSSRFTRKINCCLCFNASQLAFLIAIPTRQCPTKTDFNLHLAPINQAGGLYGRILTEVVSTDRTTEVNILPYRSTYLG